MRFAKNIYEVWTGEIILRIARLSNINYLKEITYFSENDEKDKMFSENRKIRKLKQFSIY